MSFWWSRPRARFGRYSAGTKQVEKGCDPSLIPPSFHARTNIARRDIDEVMPKGLPHPVARRYRTCAEPTTVAPRARPEQV